MYTVTKFCTKCSTEKPVTEFYVDRNRPDGLYANCRSCFRKVSRSYQQRIRLEAIEALGGICSWPDCTWTDPRALQIDHVNGGGATEGSRHTKAWFTKVLSNREDFQLLCANHNWIKRIENREGRPLDTYERQVVAEATERSEEWKRQASINRSEAAKRGWAKRKGG